MAGVEDGQPHRGVLVPKEPIDLRQRRDFTAWKVAEPADVMSANMDEVKALIGKREEIQKKITLLHEHLANIETLEEAITMYSLTALGEDN